ncbi:MAG: TRAP transporter large permease subunit, partial [Desulfopila sp.]|nr:TRAP transporter large permease subunit [Desulfopila sp.]
MSGLHLLFAALALAGAPLFIVISAIALLSFSSSGIEISVVIIEMARLTETPLLLSLPLFIFTGMLLSESNAPQRILSISRVFFGWLPGGLGVISLIVCAVFTAFTGASGVTIFALGGLLLPALQNDGYGKNFSMGLVTSSGSLGLLFPPSLPLILYGVISGSRIDHLFLAGLLPGIFMMIILSTYTMYRSPPRKETVTRSEAITALRSCMWELPLPFIVLGGIYGGYLVAGEAAAIAAVYVLVVEVIILKDISLAQVPKIMAGSMVLFGGILVILAASMASTNFLIDQEIPQRLFEFLQHYISSKYTFLLLLNIFLLIAGAMLDIFSAIVLIVPLILPIAAGYNVDPIHLGIIFLTNLQIGYCTPPVGINLFLASYRFNTPIIEIYRACLPFLGLLLFTLLFITYYPA